MTADEPGVFYDESEVSQQPDSWVRPSAFYSHRIKYVIYLIIVLYLVWAFFDLRITMERFLLGLDAGERLLRNMFPPTTYRSDDVIRDTTATIQMAVIATIVGTLLAIPLAAMASENLVPKPIYATTRMLLATARAFHELVLAIFFVAIFGFGAFAGVLALVIKSVGFIGKLLAEDIEDIDPGPVEAIESTGAGKYQVWLYAIAPQVVPRFIGLAIYRWDINIRQSTIVGIVGAGGVGFLLITAFENYDYRLVTTILLVIIVIVLIGEYISLYVRRRFIK